ncbi:MAG: UDP-N-acetylglucosamine--N-acetylmuramyl-(pentapeptide) pyrophosphoryl-undecaprenol N-acetylglucosamine transferase, partial [Gammaproteobacteria bacterium]
GLTNRILARLATRVLEAFPGRFPPARGAECTGNPVRREITELPPPAERMAGRSGPLRLLVLGGSQGAQALNEVVPAALHSLDDEHLVAVRHQAGPRHLESARRSYGQVPAQVKLCGFIKDMAEAYGWADVVLCRAGAMTVSELTAAGTVSILVPFPHAVDDHQTRNACHLVDGDAGLLLPQSELSGARLGDLLRELAGARERLQAMAEAARRLAVPDSADRVGRLCAEVAGA